MIQASKFGGTAWFPCNMLAMNYLSHGRDVRNAGLGASFRTPFFGFVDYKGHSRFVLQILISLSSHVRFAPPISHDAAADG